MDTRTTTGLIATSVWLGTAVGLVIVKWETVVAMSLNSIGDYLAGVFSPIAFLWLVIGYFQQGEELRLNTAALKLQADELRNSVAEQAALVEATKKQVELMDKTQREQRQQEIRRAQLILRHLGGAGGKDNGTVNWRLKLRNVGHSVTQVKLESNSRLVGIRPDYFHFIDNEQEIEVLLTYYAQEAEGERNYLSFCYMDGRGVPSEHLLFFKIRDTRPEIFYQPEEMQ